VVLLSAVYSGEGGQANTEFTNCTFSNNRAECNADGCQATGGAIGSGGGSHISCNFCTFDSNRAACTGARCSEVGDAISASGGGTEISNSIINGDRPSNNCGTLVSNVVVSLGYNIDNGSSCINGSVTGDKPNTDPLFNPDGLQDNGGPAKTVAIEPGSPAIDMADPACPPPFTDERGVTRPQQAACDIGAYELLVQVSNIPTMSEWGLIITTGLLGIAGLMVIRRRKAAA
jgi:IPTL-CTERM motif